MKRLKGSDFILTALAMMTCSICLGQDNLYSNIEFNMPHVTEPVFPDLFVDLMDYHALGDGLFDNSTAFEEAINTLSEKGGGRLIVPEGIWLTGPIVFKDNIEMHLNAGAVIIFSKDKSKYPLIQTSFEGLETYRCQSPISGKGLENIAITGSGIVDGSGGAWRAVKKDKMSSSEWKQLLASGGVLSEDGKIWYPSEAYQKANELTKNFNVPPFKTKAEFEAVKDFLRPVMVSFVDCKKVLLDGPTFQNSPAWNLHPLMCEDVTIRNLTIRNPWYSQNGDGLDLESCKNVVINNNSFDVGDDAICFKSGKNEDGRKRGIPTENVIVRDNIVYHGHGGFVIGSEMSGGVKNVHVSNCTFLGTDVGLRFKSTRGRGGVVENIYISNIDMINIASEAIRFNLFYGGESPIPEEGREVVQEPKPASVPVSEETPSFRNIHITDITSTGSGTAALFQGLPEMKLSQIYLENVLLDAGNGITMIDADKVEMKNVKVLQKKGHALTIYNSNHVNLDGFTYNKTMVPTLRILGEDSGNIRITHSTLKSGQVMMGKEVKEKAVKIR